MSEIQSLARGLAILDRLAETPEGLSTTEIAEVFEMDKGNASRFIRTLAKYGFAEKDPETRRYSLGPQIVRLSRAILTRMSLRETAKPYLNGLIEQTGECAHLAILVQGQALYIDQAESPQTLRVSTGVGTMAPLHCTALGKILLAFSEAPVNEELETFTPRTITNQTLLQHHLEQVKNQGYAIDDEEYEPGVRCVAVPVLDYREKCVAAMGISGPTSRISLEKLPGITKIVKEIGNSLSARLSFKNKES